MTLAELAHMRRLRAKPAFPVVLTTSGDVHSFCAVNDLPVIWAPALAADADLRPLHGLDVWVVDDAHALADLKARITQHRPKSLWCVGSYGYTHRIQEAIGRPIWN
jgi:hypothetical protein